MKLRLPRHGGLDAARALFPEGLAAADVLDFSISINPLGPPPGLKDALAEALASIHRYPEITAATLTEKLAERHGLTPDNVIVGNGTADLLFALAPRLPGKKAVIPSPTFIEYERVCALNDYRIRHVPHNGPWFALDAKRIVEALAGGATLFLCQPNNPTGRCLDPGELEEILKKTGELGAAVVLDEAFLPFTDTPSTIPLIHRYDHLIVLRSMTKTFGIPGLRLGYAVAAPAVIERWKAFLPPWNVNTLAQTAGLYCLKNGEAHLTASRRYIQKEKQRVFEEIRKLGLFKPLPSEANFFLVSLDTESLTATDLYLSLARRGILVRHCGSFRGMGDGHVRIGLKKRAENDRLLSALLEITRRRSCHARAAAAASTT